MKKIFVFFCFIFSFLFSAFAQGYKIAEPYDTSGKSGKTVSKSTQKYTYLYDTSLIQAIKLKDEHRTMMLLYSQVNPNEKNDEGFTPLFFAAQYLEPETLTLLLDKGAKVNLPSTYNLTPLMAAAAAGRDDNIEVLLQYGADPNLLDDKELSALDHAYNNRQLKAVVLLEPVTTVVKPAKEEVPAEDNINGKAALEHASPLPQKAIIPAEVNMEEEEAPEIVLEQEEEPKVEEPKVEEQTPSQAAIYNPTVAEIDARIENTRQALNRLLQLKNKILESEEQLLQAQEAQKIKPTKTKPAKTEVKMKK